MQKNLFYCLELVLIVIVAQPLSAQTAGTLRGKVLDREGQPLPMASVYLMGQQKGTTTDSAGRFRFQGIAPGQTVLRIGAPFHRSRLDTLQWDGRSPLSTSVALRPLELQTEEVTVTATRSRQAENVPQPIDVIDQQQIEQMGSSRLSEVLREQTGLQIVSDHGTGLQMQGLSSEYILILINGEPVIGRTAGTLDLERIPVQDIRRIEILKGPSSSLYGSEALAGVINIITRESPEGLHANAQGRARSNQTLDLSSDLSYREDKLQAGLFVNRFSTAGYDREPDTRSQTAPAYRAYTFSPQASYRFSQKWKASIRTRFYHETQQNAFDIEEEGQTAVVDDEQTRTNWRLMPQLTFRPGARHKFRLRNYLSGYGTTSDIRYRETGQAFDNSSFDQTFNRAELTYDFYLNANHVTTLGAGHLLEGVNSTRYQSVAPFQAGYGYFQHQWTPWEKLSIIGGGRFDAHSEYGSRFSPKLSAGFEPFEGLKINGSMAGGFKAPDFRQLLLDFTNPTAGYSVFGARNVAQGLQRLEDQGQIDEQLRAPAQLGDLEAESSLSFNLGLEVVPLERLKLEANVFRNQVENLIETAPVARKTNGQNVFTYFNLEEIRTQGLELQAAYRFLEGFRVSAGYQYLQALDQDVVEDLEAGKVFRRNPETGQTETVPRSAYGGLLNRSAHSGNLRLFYQNERHHFGASARWVYRGRWGVRDANSNGILDLDSEYAEGYGLLNLSVHKSLFGWLRLEAGIDNLTDVTNPYEPSLPGRVGFVGAKMQIDQIIN